MNTKLIIVVLICISCVLMQVTYAGIPVINSPTISANSLNIQNLSESQKVGGLESAPVHTQESKRNISITLENNNQVKPTNAILGTTSMVSVKSDGNYANSESDHPSVSGDGRYVAFSSLSSDLVSGDTNGVQDVFIHDRASGITRRISSGIWGEGNGISKAPVISADGRYIAFQSFANNLIEGDMNAFCDIFVYDRIEDNITRVSVNSAGVEANAGSYYPSISGDGRYIAFYTTATNLANTAGLGNNDVYVHDQDTKKTTLISKSSSGTAGNGNSLYPSISDDGIYIAFSSDSQNLDSSDTGDAYDIFYHDLEIGTTSRVLGGDSLSQVQPNGDSFYPSISANGRYIAFTSDATNLVKGEIDSNGVSDVFVIETNQKKTSRISVDSSENQVSGGGYNPRISADGNYIAFGSGATSLVPGDLNSKTDVFLRNRYAGTTTLVSVFSEGGQGIDDSCINDDDYVPDISSDGRYIVFSSGVSFQYMDNNEKNDVFIRDQMGVHPTISSVQPSQSGSLLENTPITISGTDFKRWVRVWLEKGSLIKGAEITAQTQNSISCILPTKGLSKGTYELNVRNHDSSGDFVYYLVSDEVSVISASPSSVPNNALQQVTFIGTNFEEGTTVKLDYSGFIIPAVVNKINSTAIVCTFQFTGAPSGFYMVTLTPPGKPPLTFNAGFQVVSAGNIPTITDFNPKSGVNNAILPFTIIGTNFRAGAKVKITMGGIMRVITPSSINDTKIVCNLPLTGLAVGLYSLTVLNSDKSSATIRNSFMVQHPTPVITAVTPESSSDLSPTISITGSRFVNGAKVVLKAGTTSFPGTITQFSSTKIVAKFSLTSTPGKLDLHIINPGGSSITKTNAYTLLLADNPPSISDFAPKSGISNAPAFKFSIDGDNFRKGAKVRFSQGSTTRAIIPISVSDEQIKASVPLSGLPNGLYLVSVLNLDGTVGSSGTPFTVSNPSPVITSLTPISGFNSGNVLITITGSNFVNGATTFLKKGLTTIDGFSPQITGNSIKAWFNLKGSTVGSYDLVVRNPGTADVTKTNAFTVTLAGVVPVINEITPESGDNTEVTKSVTITGTGFRKGAKVRLNNIKKEITPSLISDTEIRCNLPLSGQPVGNAMVLVLNSDGTMASKSFTVKNPTPIMTSISPASGFNNDITNVTITGSKFVKGIMYELSNGVDQYSGLVSSVSSTKLVVRLYLNGVTPGAYQLKIFNPSSDLFASRSFTVLLPGPDPITTGVNPASGYNTGNLPVTITGSGFNKPTVFIGPGILSRIAAPPTVGKVSTSTTLYVTLPLTDLKELPYSIYVKNSDGGISSNLYFYVTDQNWVTRPKTGGGSSSVVQQRSVPSIRPIPASLTGREVLRNNVIAPIIGK